jgi:hypothetical protein
MSLPSLVSTRFGQLINTDETATFPCENAGPSKSRSLIQKWEAIAVIKNSMPRMLSTTSSR